MPKSTSRKDQLIADCVRLATIVGRLARDGTDVEYRARLGTMSLPAIEKERGQLELEKRRRYTATPDSLVRSAGPGVVDIFLRDVGLTVFLQRVDLLEVVLNGGVVPEPLHQRVLEMIDADDATDEMMAAPKMAESMQAMRAIACAVCVVPPAQYFADPNFGVDQMTEPHTYARQFVMPGQPCKDGQLPIYVPELEPRADGWRGLKKNDLRSIVKATIDNGPGAMLSFRLRQEDAVALAHDGADDGPAPEPAVGDSVPMGGDRSRSRGKRVRAVGGGKDG